MPVREREGWGEGGKIGRREGERKEGDTGD